MKKRSIRIEKLDLRLRGADPAAVPEIARLIGPALGEVLSAEPRVASRIGELNAGKLHVRAGASAAEIAGRIAAEIGRAIRNHEGD